MRYVLDANILLRLADNQSVHHSVVVTALGKLKNSGHDFVIFPQSLHEFWSVGSRPVQANGVGISTTDLVAWLNYFQSQFQLLPETSLCMTEWQRLMTHYGPIGKPSHDCRYVASMLAHGLTHLVTLNGRDFARYTVGEGIVVVDPHNV